MTGAGRQRWLLIGGTVLVAALAAWWHFGGEYEEQLRFSPDNVKLATDPFHAAERWLARNGIDAEPLSDWDYLEWSYHVPVALIVPQAPGQYTEAQSRSLWNWVADGGHLIAPAPRGYSARAREYELNPHHITACWRCEEEEDELRADSVLKTQAGTFELWSYSSLDVTGGGVKSWRDQHGRVLLAQYPIGEGRVTLIPDTDLFGNQALLRPGHARLLLAMIDDDREYVMIQHRAGGGGLLAWLWRQAPALWLVALLIAVLWVWSKLPRLGPVADEGREQATQMREHLLATARYDWRHNQGRQLLASLNEERAHRCARRFPDWRRLDLIEQRERLQTLCPDVSKEALDRLVTARRAARPEELIEYVALHNELMHAL